MLFCNREAIDEGERRLTYTWGELHALAPMRQCAFDKLEEFDVLR